VRKLSDSYLLVLSYKKKFRKSSCTVHFDWGTPYFGTSLVKYVHFNAGRGGERYDQQSQCPKK